MFIFPHKNASSEVSNVMHVNWRRRPLYESSAFGSNLPSACMLHFFGILFIHALLMSLLFGFILQNRWKEEELIKGCNLCDKTTHGSFSLGAISLSIQVDIGPQSFRSVMLTTNSTSWHVILPPTKKHVCLIITLLWLFLHSFYFLFHISVGSGSTQLGHTSTVRWLDIRAEALCSFETENVTFVPTSSSDRTGVWRWDSMQLSLKACPFFKFKTQS